jgi:peroxiredoxin
VTGAVFALIAVGVGVLLATRPTSALPPPAAVVAPADRSAPASLVRAANAVHFRPTTEPGVGLIEKQHAWAGTQTPPAYLLPVGSKAPVFTLKTPEGARVSLADLRGKAVLLEFFATWCPHCNAEAPHLRSLYASLPKSRYAFLSVNADGENAASIFAFHGYYGLRYPALLDPSAVPGSYSRQGAAGAVTTRYRLQVYPTFYVIDPTGRIVWAAGGEQPDALLRKGLARAAARA